MASEGFRPLDEKSLLDYIKATPPLVSQLGGQLDGLQIKEVGDGNLNFVYIVVGSAGSLVVKQALPYVRLIGESWPMTKERAYFEAAALKEHGRLCPSHVPTVYHFDRVMSLIGMRYLEPPHIILRKGLIAGVEYPLLAEHMSEYMAKTLFFTSLLYRSTTEHKHAIAEFCGNVEMCRLTEKVVFSDPYKVSQYNRWTTPYLDKDAETVREDNLLKLEVADLKSMFCERAQALIHADLHTSSIMVTHDSTQVIDSEFAFYGPMGYDIGAFLGNLILAFYSQDGHASEENNRKAYKTWILQTIEATWSLFHKKFVALWDENKDGNGEAYLPQIYNNPDVWQLIQRNYMEKLFHDSLGFGAAKMIRRILGVAHVEDFESITDAKRRAECERKALNFAKMLLKERVKFVSIGQVISAIQQGRLIIGSTTEPLNFRRLEEQGEELIRKMERSLREKFMSLCARVAVPRVPAAPRRAAAPTFESTSGESGARPSPAPEATTHTSPRVVPPSSGAPTGRSPTVVAGPEAAASSEPAVVRNDHAPPAPAPLAPVPSASTPSAEGEGHKHHWREKSHGGPSKRLKRAARRASESTPPSRPAMGAAREGTAPESTGIRETAHETPEAAQTVHAGSSQQAPPPPETSTTSFFTSVGCKEVALHKYDKSVLPVDRKKVEEPTVKSLHEALVFAGRAFDTIDGFIPFFNRVRQETEAQNKEMDDLTQENELLRNEKDSFEVVRGDLEGKVAELSGAVDPLRAEVEALRKAVAYANDANTGLVLELSIAKDTLVAREESLEVARKAVEDKAALLDLRLREFNSLMARHQELQRKHSEEEERHQEIMAKKLAEQKDLYKKMLEDAREVDLAKINGTARERDEAKQALADLSASFSQQLKGEVSGATVQLIGDFLDEVERQWPFKEKDDLVTLFLKISAPETVSAGDPSVGAPEAS